MAVLCCAVPRGSVMSNSLQPMDCLPPGSSVHGDSPSKNTGVGCHALLQGIFPNPVLPRCRWIFTIWATREALKLCYYAPPPKLSDPIFKGMRASWFSIVEQISSTFHKGFRLSDNLLMSLWVQQCSPISTSDYINIFLQKLTFKPKMCSSNMVLGFYFFKLLSACKFIC